MATRNNSITVRDRSAQFARNVQKITGTAVYVGITADHNARSDDAPITNSEIGYIMEFGSPESNIPARPFLVPGMRHAMPEAISYLQQAATYALAGDDEGVQRALTAAGQVSSDGVKHEIVSGSFEPLAPRTIAARQRRGNMSDKPLIDTGDLLRSVTFALRRENGETIRETPSSASSRVADDVQRGANAGRAEALGSLPEGVASALGTLIGRLF